MTTPSAAKLVTLAIAFATLHVAGASRADTPPVERKERPGPTPQDDIIVDYAGRIQDGAGKPISGVFQLRFEILASEDARSAKWAETRFVSVVDGAYRVNLGQRRKLRSHQIPSSPWISVVLVGEAELVRDELLLDGDAAPAAGPPDQLTISSETQELLKRAAEGESVTFADVAQRAVIADSAQRASDADSLGGLTAEQIKELANLALERLGDHIADPSAHEAAGGLRLGSQRQVTDSAGGEGGDTYELNCPSGYVVTGIRGGAGRLIDSVSVICQPLR